MVRRGRVGLLVALAALTGCGGRQLVGTPNLLLNQDPQSAFAACPDCCRRPDMEVLYATDRAPTEDGTAYGPARSRNLAFGVARVNLAPNRTWNDVARDSTASTRQTHYEMKFAGATEAGRFDLLAASQPTLANELQLVGAADAQKAYEKSLHEVLRKKLALTSHKDVFVFVHGFNATFDSAVFRAGEVWHFMGRVGVPIAYTWPAGYGGLFGYAYDRESGEFTVTHLKQFLLAVANCPEVERLHLIAHSRGTDVAISALRELHIGYRAQGKATPDALKLENLVLAAPDLDEEVFVQRFVAENLLAAARRTTIYASRSDRALVVADAVFGGRKRLGVLEPRDFTPNVRKALARMPNLQFIDCNITGDSINHDYVFGNPAALSDLILVLRDRRPPGAEHGRPLRQPLEGVWELSDGYLKK